jgi:bacterioferritin-associated ferredoxin
MCGAGSNCGGCQPTISELIEAECCEKRRVSLPVLVDFTEAASVR